MRTFHHAVWSQITGALEGKKLVYECPLDQILRIYIVSSSLYRNFHANKAAGRGRYVTEGKDKKTHSAGVAIDALKSTAIELVLSD
jgi:hypothetical protein